MITTKIFNTTKASITWLEITNKSGASVILSNLGAGIISVNVPDRGGRLDDVCLGYSNPEDYFNDSPVCGRIPGRFANRISKGKFILNGHEYGLQKNDGPNCLHSGESGLQNQLWKIKSITENSVTFEYISKDGEGGFPGLLHASATYEWTDENELKLTISATTDSITVVNLTNHAYWNLKGHNSGSVLEHELMVNADSYLPTDELLIPTGEIASVENTPMDFRSPTLIGKMIAADFPAIKGSRGYDSCWVTARSLSDKIRLVATLYDPQSGRMLKVESNQPGVQIYSGNWLGNSPILNKACRKYDDYDGVAIECQNFPDSPNIESFPSAVLQRGDSYVNHINFKFEVIDM